RDHEPSPPECQQVVSPHHPQNSLVVHWHSSPAQLGTDSPVAVAPTMFQGDLLNRRPHFRLFLGGPPLLKRAVEARSTDAGQLAHALDAQVALQRHQLGFGNSGMQNFQVLKTIQLPVLFTDSCVMRRAFDCDNLPGGANGFGHYHSGDTLMSSEIENTRTGLESMCF